MQHLSSMRGARFIGGVHGAACGRKGAANEVLLACSPVLAAEAEAREERQDTRVTREAAAGRVPRRCRVGW